MQRKLTVLAFFFILIVIGSVTCFAQQYPFVHYTPREGLVNNRARFVFQDSKGKLYIATYGGLSVYDGSRFVNYTMNNGLADALINDVVEMGDDSIWVVPNVRKINCIVKGRLKNFTPSDNFTPLINEMIKAGNGIYYAFSDDGLFRLENNRFVKITMKGIPGADSIKTLLQGVEADKKLYILTNPDYKLNGSNLLVYDLSSNQLIVYDKNIHASTLFNTGNEIWVATSQGTFMIDKAIHKDKPITLKPIADSFHLPKNLFAHFIYKDRQNNMWFSTGAGVYKVNKNGETNLYTVENGLTTNPQTSILQDSENNMWFTNEQTGLSKLSNQQLAYYPVLKPNFTVSDIFIPPSSDSIWLYDGNYHRMRLLLPDKQTKEYSCSNESLPYSGTFVSANGEWILSGFSIYKWKANPKTNKYSLAFFYKDSSNISGFTCGASDRNGNLVTISSKVTLFAGNKIMSEPIYYMADQLTVDKDNRIWVATRSNHLYCFGISGTGNDTKLSLLRSFQALTKGSPRSITADKTGNIWIGTRDVGLYRIHFNGLTPKSIHNFTTLNGMSEDFINYLFCDKDNNIWACTHSGLDKIKIVRDHFLVENITAGNNLYFPVSKIQQTASGMFWILTNAGIITYNPVRPSTGDWKPQLLFSNVTISNAQKQLLLPGQELRYFQNNLVFQLAAPTYIDEKQTRFSYLLEGSGNENWSELSANPSINLVNLSPGHYTLKAKAVFLHGLYPDAVASFSFTVLPPWWQTWWFKLSLSVLILALALLALRYYINRKLELQRVILEKKRAIEKERTRIATDMHDDLGAGLSRIKFLSETIGMKKQQHLPIEEEIDSIRSYSHEMIDKMGEIVWALNEKNDTLSDLLSYTRSYAVEYLAQNGIHCLVEEPDDIPQLVVSSEFRRNIYLTVKEALHNIVKHAQATDVLINIEITEHLSIQIKDNGKGIDEGRMSSFGNGLFNMSNRIQELKGRFQIIDRNGTLIDLIVPLNS